jgi:hypothetical protein
MNMAEKKEFMAQSGLDGMGEFMKPGKKTPVKDLTNQRCLLCGEIRKWCLCQTKKAGHIGRPNHLNEAGSRIVNHHREDRPTCDKPA